MLKKLITMALAVSAAAASADSDYFGCRIPGDDKLATFFLFRYNDNPKGLLDGDDAVLAAWPYGKLPHKCGVSPVYDLNQKNEAKPSQGIKTSAVLFTCQRATLGGGGLNVSTVSFMFDRTSEPPTLWNAAYVDMNINDRVKDKYIATSVSEPRRFQCEKLDPNLFKDPGSEGGDQEEDDQPAPEPTPVPVPQP